MFSHSCNGIPATPSLCLSNQFHWRINKPYIEYTFSYFFFKLIWIINGGSTPHPWNIWIVFFWCLSLSLPHSFQIHQSIIIFDMCSFVYTHFIDRCAFVYLYLYLSVCVCVFVFGFVCEKFARYIDAKRLNYSRWQPMNEHLCKEITIRINHCDKLTKNYSAYKDLKCYWAGILSPNMLTTTYTHNRVMSIS